MMTRSDFYEAKDEDVAPEVKALMSYHGVDAMRLLALIYSCKDDISEYFVPVCFFDDVKELMNKCRINAE
jgi:hypothetical protein